MEDEYEFEDQDLLIPEAVAAEEVKFPDSGHRAMPTEQIPKKDTGGETINTILTSGADEVGES